MTSTGKAGGEPQVGLPVVGREEHVLTVIVPLHHVVGHTWQDDLRLSWHKRTGYQRTAGEATKQAGVRGSSVSLPVEKGSGGNQQHCRACTSSGGGGEENQRRQPQRQGSRGEAVTAAAHGGPVGQNVLETIKAMLMAARQTQNPAVMPIERG